MNAIRQTQALNRRELENATPPSASWHADYRDTAWIYIGGLPLDLSEGDVVTIFSQYGNPTHLNMIRDRETGKPKGFGFLKYEDQRSCDLAVDNLGGADVLGRMLRVDHTRYKKRDDEDEDTHRIDRLEAEAALNEHGKRASDTEDDDTDDAHRHGKRRRRLRHGEEEELEEMLAIKSAPEEDEDPMREYLIREKREQVEQARQRDEQRDRDRHRHHHRRRRDDDDEKDRKGHRHRRDRPKTDMDADSTRHRHRSRGETPVRDRDRDRTPDMSDGDTPPPRRSRKNH